MLSITLGVIVVISAAGAEQAPPTPPDCGGPDQPPCRSFTVDPGRFPGPGTFNIDLIATIIRLTGPVTCVKGVTITPSGPPKYIKQITPAIIEIPARLATTPQKPGWIVECFAITTIGRWYFAIAIGPEPPKGPPPVPISGSSPKLAVNAFRSTQDSITFAVKGLRVADMRVEIFDLGGRLIFSHEAEGAYLVWNLSRADGQPVANGVYLYTVTVNGVNGESLRSGVRKLAVLR